MKYTQHEIKEMDSTGVQRCIHCGTIILDYRKICATLVGTGLGGYAAGLVYVSESGGTTGARHLPGHAEIIECKK